MFTKSVAGSALLALSLFTAVPVFAAEPTIDQVYQAAVAGRYDDAQTMMDKVLHDHPNSAKAHYVEADLMAKQNRLGEAKTELDNAIRLDPSEKFAKPAALAELKTIIAGPHHVVQAARPVYAQPVYSHPVTRSDEGGGGMLTIIVIIGLVLLFFAIVRMFSRRNTVVTNYQGGYGGGVAAPGYGPGGMVVNQGGMGSGILGGLATGAAVGAGIVAGEELMHHLTDHERRDTYYDDTPAPSQDSGWNSRNDDMGGNDFGVSDNSSWDSGGGGGGGGSDDWN